MTVKNEASGTKNVVSGVAIGNRQSTIGNAFALFVDVLREIFDENAYSRFLHLHQLPPSRHSYAMFLRDHSNRRERRPRCC